MNRDQFLTMAHARADERFPGGIDPSMLEICLDAIIESVADTIASGEPITFVGLGSIEPVSQRERALMVSGQPSRPLTKKSVVRFVPGRQEETEADFEIGY